jgi:hypothetical protein
LVSRAPFTYQEDAQHWTVELSTLIDRDADRLTTALADRMVHLLRTTGG